MKHQGKYRVGCQCQYCAIDRKRGNRQDKVVRRSIKKKEKQDEKKLLDKYKK